MHSSISSRHIFICLVLILISSILFIRYNFHRIPFTSLQKAFHSHCFEWQSIDNRLFTIYGCPRYSQLSSLIWTYDGTGLMKYIQWLVTRKLANIRITRLNDHCYITQDHSFFTNSTDNTFIQIYIISLSANFTDQSKCSMEIEQIARINIGHRHQIYFKRKSIKATAFFQQLDSIGPHYNCNLVLNTSLIGSIEKTSYFSSIKWTLVNSEDLIKSNLTDCENALTNFLSLLGLNISSEMIQNMIAYDSHQFLDDATWWDRSEVAEHLLTMSIPSRPSILQYSNDFYYLHGEHSFVEYLSKNRRCYNEGLFSQLQIDSIINRSSTDKPDRCPSKPFDCAFSDIYSFADREKIYQPFDTQHYFNENTIKCAFAVPSVFDKVRKRYARNHTCETIIFTSITSCYDPLPEVKGTILPSFCFVALLDTKTIQAYEKFYPTKPKIEWDLLDLGPDATPFSVAAKSIETLKIVGERMFPLAKWIIWLDGKAHMADIPQLLAEAQAPIIGAAHPDHGRTSASEVAPTIGRLGGREKPNSQRLINSVLDINIQEQEYKRDGFYSRSDTLKLKMYDIAVFLYRNNHPCISRYLCAWHNEINYYSYRGQLSVYYPAVRFNLTNYLHFLPNKFYTTVGHRAVC